MYACTSAATGIDKDNFATEAQAQHACAEFKEKLRRDGDRDWQRLNHYYCATCDCWHVGRRHMGGQPHGQPCVNLKIRGAEIAKPSKTPVQNLGPSSKAVPAKATDGPSAAFTKIADGAPVSQGIAPELPTIEREVAKWVAETALTVGCVAIGLSVLAGKAVASGIRNWLKKSTPGE